MAALSALLVAVTAVYALLGSTPRTNRQSLGKELHRIGRESAKSNTHQPHRHGHYPGLAAKPTVQSLQIYPVKSCRGVELTQSRVLPSGLEHDRIYTFARLDDAPNEGEPAWHFLTQRQLPLLANLAVEIWVANETEDGKRRGGVLGVRFPWTRPGWRGLGQTLAVKMRTGLSAVPEKEFLLPLAFPSDADIDSKGYEHADIKIWKETVRALNLEKEIPQELKRYLGVKGRIGLFRMDPRNQRQVFRCAPRKENIGFQPVVDFHDAYPLHMLNLNSLYDLESKIEGNSGLQRLDPRRFRANIIISGAEKFDEETWKAIQCAYAGHKRPRCVFHVSCRTVRCKMPNVDPASGVQNKTEPDFSLRKYRDVDPGAPKMGCLGMQLCAVFPDVAEKQALESTLEVGMEIDVLQRGSHLYIKQ